MYNKGSEIDRWIVSNRVPKYGADVFLFVLRAQENLVRYFRHEIRGGSDNGIGIPKLSPTWTEDIMKKENYTV